MLINKPFRKLTHGLRSHSSSDFRVALGIAIFTTGVSILRVSFDLGYYYDVFKCYDSPRLLCSMSFEDSHLIAITLGLFISVIGLWSRRATGFFISLLALIWTWRIYLYWHTATLSEMRKNGLTEFSQLGNQKQHVLVLTNAAWWDLVVLSVTIILFIWQIKTLIMILMRTRNKQSIAV